MHQTAKHTELTLNSKAAAYGYEACSRSASKALYAKSSKTKYTYRAYRQAGFGAGYYSSDLSVLLSEDSMAFKYPNESPYSYVGNILQSTIPVNDTFVVPRSMPPYGN